MANLTIRDLPDELYETLRAQAKAHRRSIAGETTVILQRALGGRSTGEDQLLRRAEKLRERTPAYLSEEKRRKAARQGRA